MTKDNTPQPGKSSEVKTATDEGQVTPVSAETSIVGQETPSTGNQPGPTPRNLNPEFDAIPPQPQDQEIMAQVQAPPMSGALKYAVETIPKFNGYDMPVSHFIEACEDAKQMVPPEMEKSLTQIARNKLRGEPRRAIHGMVFDTMKDFNSYLNKLYAPAKTLYQLQGELGQIFQADNEGVVAYSNRAKDLAHKIKEAHKTTNNVADIDADTLAKYDKEFTDCLIKGLKPEFENKVSKDKPFKDTITEAVQIEKELQAKSLLRGYRIPKNAPNAPYQRNSYRNFGTREVNLIQDRSIKCQLCKKFGHDAAACRFRYTQNSQTQKPHPQFGARPGIRFAINSSNNPPREAETNQGRRVCSYCQAPGHWVGECRKQAYYKSLKEKAENQRPSTPVPQSSGAPQSNQPSENFKRPPRLSAPRESGPSTRKVMHVQMSEEAEVPEWPQSN